MNLPTIGAAAPHFQGPDQHGNTVSLTDFAGKKVVLYFYPKDDTPGCTAEACNLRDHHNMLLEKGLAVVGVSTDSVKSHAKFATKFELPFSLIADEDQKIVNDYGVWGEKTFMGRKYMGTNRVTFIIDEQGMLIHVFEKVETKDHTAQILNALGL
jgi:peroxiredoxin Q/BCP